MFAATKRQQTPYTSNVAGGALFQVLGDKDVEKEMASEKYNISSLTSDAKNIEIL